LPAKLKRQKMTNERTGRQPFALEGNPVQTARGRCRERERERRREMESERLGEGLNEYKTRLHGAEKDAVRVRGSGTEREDV
jgi:hypothetical protein